VCQAKLLKSSWTIQPLEDIATHKEQNCAYNRGNELYEATDEADIQPQRK